MIYQHLQLFHWTVAGDSSISCWRSFPATVYRGLSLLLNWKDLRVN